MPRSMGTIHTYQFRVGARDQRGHVAEPHDDVHSGERNTQVTMAGRSLATGSLAGTSNASSN